MRYEENEEVLYSFAVGASKTKFFKATFVAYAESTFNPNVPITRVKRDEYGQKVGEIRKIKAKTTRATITFTQEGKEVTKLVPLDTLQKMTKAFSDALNNPEIAALDVSAAKGFNGYSQSRVIMRHKGGKLWETATSRRWTYTQLAELPENTYKIFCLETGKNITDDVIGSIRAKAGGTFPDSGDVMSQTKYNTEPLDNFWMEK